jgi:hypothetical protein
VQREDPLVPLELPVGVEEVAGVGCEVVGSSEALRSRS